MEAQIPLWLAAVALFLVGLFVGLGIGRSHNVAVRRAGQLESELVQSKRELTEYRVQVTQHFSQTADLLHVMTANYRAVYEHLAHGARQMCDGDIQALSATALRERLLPHDFPATGQQDSSNTPQPAKSSTTVVEPEGGAKSLAEEHFLHPKNQPAPTAIPQADKPRKDGSPEEC